MSTHSPARARRASDWLMAVLLIALVGGLLTLLLANADPLMAKAKIPTVRKSGKLLEEVKTFDIPEVMSGAIAPPGGFSPQVRLGFTIGDQWEPAVAADNSGHVYMMYAQYFGVPGCPNCASPTQVLQISNDGGATWGPPHTILEESTGQWDSQIVVDPADGSTVYASWMQNNKADIAVARSTDFGQTWNIVIADGIASGADKPILIARGQDVYVAYNRTNKIWLSSSHDAGQTWSHASIAVNGLGWSLPSQGAIAPDGTVYFSWNGYKKSGSVTGDVNLYLTKSTNGGASWIIQNVDISKSPDLCPEYLCGWAYLGAAIMVSTDANGHVYTLYNLGTTAGGPERIYFRKSTDGGASWSPRVDVSAAPNGKHHAFPALWAGGNGNVKIAWMDNRNTAGDGTPMWNVYYRTSSNGGSTWSGETDLSTFVSGFTYIFPEGFRFPFGDYWELDVDGSGKTHFVFGEGFSYDSPGSVWYVLGP